LEHASNSQRSDFGILTMTNRDGTDPEVSVIIPTFNRLPLLVAAIDSVLSQTFKDFEVIVVDDASCDGTPEFVRNIGDPRVRIVSLPIQGGGATARNAGIDVARGKYLAFLDSDDKWLRDKLAKQMELARRDQDKNVVYFTKLFARSETNETIVPRKPIKTVENVGDYFFLNWGDGFIQTSSIFLHSTLAKSVMFTDGLPIHQDWDFCIRLENQGARFVLLDEPLVIWNIDKRPDRIGEKASSMGEDSIRWIESVKNMISGKAYLSFKAHLPINAAAGGRRKNFRRLIKAIGAGALTPREIVSLGYRLLTSTDMRK